MPSKVIDFDAYRRDREARLGAEEPVVFRIGGKEYPLPQEPPAVITIDVIRLKETLKDATADVPLAALAKIGAEMFGEETFRTILEENHVGAAEMGELILHAFGAWSLDLEAEEGAARPNRKARRAKTST